MSAPPRVSILIHERDPYPKVQALSIWGVAAVWKELGADVRVLRGVRETPADADLLIPQVDLTTTPDEYVRYIERFPRVANRRVTDVSKRRISTNLLMRGQAYDGPVIVKTDRNYGGLRESHLTPSPLASVVGHAQRVIDGAPVRGFRFRRVIRPWHYPIFPALDDVPAAVWSNRHLVVEKYIPERHDGYYCIRICLCLGDVLLNRRLYSRRPVIKGAPDWSEEVPVPAGLVAFREWLGIDYGKIDYVMHDDEVHVLDANPTPGLVADAAVNAQIARKLAAGLPALLGTGSAGLKPGGYD